LDKEHSSYSQLHGAVGCIIKLSGYGLEEEHAQVEEELEEIEEDLRIIGWWRSPSHRRDVRKKRCTTQWKTPSSLFARTDSIHG
jgi:hypothetical protein